MFRLLIILFLVVGTLRFGMHYLPGATTPIVQPPLPAAEAGATVVRVVANELNAYGQAWHGLSGTGLGFGGFMLLSLPTFGPPALDLCVVSLEDEGTKVTCNARKRIGMLGGIDSTCPDSYECSWAIRLPKPPYGVVAINLDFGAVDANDLVDAFIVASPGDDVSAVADATRRSIPLLSRTRVMLPGLSKPLIVNPVEERRREAAFKVVSPTECAGGCSLSQSRVWFDSRP